MRFIPHTEAEIAAMLATIGVARLDDLIDHVPPNLRDSATIKLEAGRTEAEVAAAIGRLAAANRAAVECASFLGGGYYRHYIPAAVRAITARAEFATSYTPYQPEASQGTTQAIFEFQTLMTQLTGLEVANASMYDGASAVAEAVLMARRVLPKRSVIAVARSLWPDYRATIRSYLSAFTTIELVELPFAADGTTDLAALEAVANEKLLGVVVGYPNGFGVIEPLAPIAARVRRAGGLTITATAEALALGLLQAPGALGADLATGEAQSFGIPLQFGGPGLGFLTARAAHMRQMPGRLVGETRDQQGRRAFCLTLAAREQHIRRERATSNICTNHSLCALAAAAYLALAGRRGLRELAAHNVVMAHAAFTKLAAVGLQPRFTAPFFNEFVVTVPKVAHALTAAEQHGLLAGVPLAADYPELPDSLLVTVTETNEPSEIDLLCQALAPTPAKTPIGAH